MATTRKTQTIIGENIRRLRGLRAVAEVSLSIKINRTYWYLLENGKRNCSFKTLEKIAKLFGVTPDELLVDHSRNVRRAVLKHSTPTALNGKRTA